MAAVSMMTFGLVGCGSNSPQSADAAEQGKNVESVELNGTIKLAGSTSMEKLCEAMAESFMERNPGVTVTVRLFTFDRIFNIDSHGAPFDNTKYAGSIKNCTKFVSEWCNRTWKWQMAHDTNNTSSKCYAGNNHRSNTCHRKNCGRISGTFIYSRKCQVITPRD